MRTIPSRYRTGVAAALLAACASLFVVTTVDAQTPPAQPDASGARPPMPPMPPHDGARGGPDMHGGRRMGGDHAMHGPGMHMMREATRLRTSLQLNAQQSALWDRAIAAMKPQHDPRADMRALHERMTAMLDDPNFDPRKLAAEMDRAETEHRARMSVVREAWFGLYDSLNPVQRGQVREFLRERLSHHDHRMHGAMGWMHRDHAERAPMAPQTPPPPSTLSR